MKRYLITALAALSLTACSSSPDSVVRDFYVHLDDGNPTKAAELISPQARAAWGGKLDARLAGVAEQFAACGGIRRLEVVPAEERGSIRVFKVKITLKSEEPRCGVKNDTVKTFNADGTWHIFLG